jgi:putative restriction endonuclease
MVVSDRVRTDFNNGNEYRRLHGRRLKLPPSSVLRPNPLRLKWHRENRFVG